MPAQPVGASPPGQRYDQYQPQPHPRQPQYDGGYGGYDGYEPYDEDSYPEPDGPVRSQAMDWTLKGLGLLGVAVVSGLLWWVFRHNSGPAQQAAPPPAQTKGTYQFVGYHDPSTSSNCADDSDKKVKEFLSAHECTSMTRALYTTKLDNQTVFTSVIEVQMSSASDAQGLDDVAKADNSGHVHDLVEDKKDTIQGGPHWLQDAGYWSTVIGNKVYIATTEYQDNTLDTTAHLGLSSVDTALKGVSADALKQKLIG